MASPWTSELRAKALSLYANNSASVIAAILLSEDRVNFSRNAVIGILHRAGSSKPEGGEGKCLPRRSPGSRNAQGNGALTQRINNLRAAPKARPIFESIPNASLRVVDLQPARPFVTIVELESGECHWPVSEVDGIHHFCCHPGARGTDPITGREIVHIYCGHHRALSVGKGTPSERAATRGVAA